jgi:hypothetical protein
MVMELKAESLLDKYEPVASRRGLVLFLRRNINNRPNSERGLDMCVYDLVNGTRTYLSRPPDIKTNKDYGHEYVLLTAADGIAGSPFLLLVADFYGCSIKVQTASPCGTWGPLTYIKDDRF